MEAVDIEEALARLRFEWVPVLGREATEPTRPRRPHFEALVVTEVGVVVMPEACLTADDPIIATLMSGMGILPAARNGTVLIRDVASFVVCAWNIGALYEPVVLCLAEHAAALAGAAEPIDHGAATLGENMLNSFVAVVAALPGSVVSEITNQITAANAAGNPRHAASIFGNVIMEIANATPPPPHVASPQAARLESARNQAAPAGARVRQTGGAGIFNGVAHNAGHP